MVCLPAVLLLHYPIYLKTDLISNILFGDVGNCMPESEKFVQYNENKLKITVAENGISKIC